MDHFGQTADDIGRVSPLSTGASVLSLAVTISREQICGTNGNDDYEPCGGNWATSSRTTWTITKNLELRMIQWWNWSEVCLWRNAACSACQFLAYDCTGFWFQGVQPLHCLLRFGKSKHVPYCGSVWPLCVMLNQRWGSVQEGAAPAAMHVVLLQKHLESMGWVVGVKWVLFMIYSCVKQAPAESSLFQVHTLCLCLHTAATIIL